MLNWEIEKQLQSEGYKIICGCDEAGRGPLAGAVAAAACILPNGLEIKGLDDSKKLTEKKREELFKTIQEAAVSYAVATCSVQEIEQYNSRISAIESNLNDKKDPIVGRIRNLEDKLSRIEQKAVKIFENKIFICHKTNKKTYEYS